MYKHYLSQVFYVGGQRHKVRALDELPSYISRNETLLNTYIHASTEPYRIFELMKFRM